MLHCSLCVCQSQLVDAEGKTGTIAVAYNYSIGSGGCSRAVLANGEGAMPEVILGRDPLTGQLVTLGDIERQSGLYILGRSGTGKTTLIEQIIVQDIISKHG